jgi:hypothetical protein
MEVFMRNTIGLIATAVLAAALASPAAAQGRTKVGMLECDVSGGIGMIIASQKQVQCIFTPAAPEMGRQEVYLGTISKLGIDVGATTGGKMLWEVVAPTTRPFGALAGHYAGATAEATVGAGVGANALVGGSNRTVTLQPISVQGQAGLNFAVGVGALDLATVR